MSEQSNINFHYLRDQVQDRHKPRAEIHIHRLCRNLFGMLHRMDDQPEFDPILDLAILIRSSAMLARQLCS